jgi:hypothetical protein
MYNFLDLVGVREAPRFISVSAPAHWPDIGLVIEMIAKNLVTRELAQKCILLPMTQEHLKSWVFTDCGVWHV